MTRLGRITRRRWFWRRLAHVAISTFSGAVIVRASYASAPEIGVAMVNYGFITLLVSTGLYHASHVVELFKR